MTREATAARSDGSVLDWRGERDDSELRRSLDAFLRDPASSHASDGLTATPGLEPPVGDAGAPAPSTASAPRAGRRISAAGLALILLGGLLVIAGAALMADTITGSRIFDQARLAELWPPALVLVGLVTITEAFVVRAATARPARPPVADDAGDRSSPGRESSRGSGPSAAPVPMMPVGVPVERGAAPAALAVAAARARGPANLADLHVPDAPASHPAAARHVDDATDEGRVMVDDLAFAAGPDARPAPDALAVLLELQALRRNRLISRKQYRAKRRAVVAGIAPRFVGSPLTEAASGSNPGGAGAARPLAYWGPTAE